MATRRAIRPAQKIKPPKQYGLDFNAEETWETLSGQIREIQNHRAKSLSFEVLHRQAYNLVLYKHGSLLYDGTIKLVIENLNSLSGQHIIPAFPTASRADPTQQAQGELLLKATRRVYDDHVDNMSKLSQVLRYMDRVHSTTAGIPHIYEAGLEHFIHEILKPPINGHVLEAILAQIQFERNGYTINRSAVKGAVDVYLSLRATRESTQTLYARDVEPAILQESKEFYAAEGLRLSESCEASEYLLRVETILHTEAARTNHYMSANTTAPLSRILEETLIEVHLPGVIAMQHSGLDSMIDSEKMDDLSRLYRLAAMVPTGLNCLKRALKASIARRGKEVNEGEADVEVADPKGKGKAKQTTPLPLALKWVQNVLDLKDKFDQIWKHSFKSDREIESGLNEAFESFINSKDKAPEFISLFIDENLKKGQKGKTDAEIESALDKTITVFRFITEKDVFERYYKGHLAKRLLNNRSVSDDAERGMLAKLKVECGHQFTQKLEGMFNDMKTSDDAMSAYRNHRNTSDTSFGLDLSVIVGTSTYWPIPQPAPSCTLPEELVRATQSFEHFYLSRHSGRRLTWQPSLGSAEVRVKFDNRKHDLTVSTFALVILLLFEELAENDFLEYKEILSSTEMPEAELGRHLQSLACGKYKILKKHPPGRDINPTDSFSFNNAFSSNLQKIKISTVASRVETIEERKETQDRVEEERRHQTEACIVRIMKDRKHMTHTDLVTETTRQLSSRFLPDPLNIKKRIEGLIEREYLARCDDRKSYNYLA